MTTRYGWCLDGHHDLYPRHVAASTHDCGCPCHKEDQ